MPPMIVPPDSERYIQEMPEREKAVRRLAIWFTVGFCVVALLYRFVIAPEQFGPKIQGNQRAVTPSRTREK